ncbi:hypothetical protein NW758_015307 [Fusarium oxysporum]|nr:hypothetical protein NW758_015307 [Fusarium oxysporum]
MTLVEAFDRGEARLARRILRVVRVVLKEVLQHQHPAAPQEACQKAGVRVHRDPVAVLLDAQHGRKVQQRVAVLLSAQLLLDATDAEAADGLIKRSDIAFDIAIEIGV